ncbi:Protein FMP52, mitochondrial [Neolecta irregularis DAH-3]|uniref:Protein FMP52, mitochondrial n=1 Tax=Neolecta irregularis (strain DAH-3) TaxID=1198029 RepID=A0A1U7LHU5_NEOID|nr:Protein FMP52, mitochondrial [Neolecta irregularis DAH-3]|eukprot:OLL22230.1 Protein FMP52, mitochondrial [Neolecta irregularis DAH-3]
MQYTAVIVGSTGLVGSKLLQQLSVHPDFSHVTALSRREMPSMPKVRNQVVDFANLEECKKHLKADFMFSCLGTTKKEAGTFENQWKIDNTLNYDLAKIAKDNGVKGYILCSSQGANPNSWIGYAKMKGKLDSDVIALAFEKVKIVRPGIIIGDRPRIRFLENVIQGLSIRIPLKWVVPAIRAEDIATAMIKLALDEKNTDIIVANEGLKALAGV